MSGPLKRSSGDKIVDAAMQEIRSEGVDVRPVELESGKGSRLGDTKFLMITVTFNVVADTEVQVDNPLDYVPTIRFPAILLDYLPPDPFVMVPVLFMLPANTEVQISNPLGYVPEIYFLGNLLDRSGADIYVDDLCTWTEETLGFKCSVDTTMDQLVAKVIIALEKIKVVHIYTDADKAGVVDPCTWTDETLGFKCSIDTSTDALTVKIIIA